MAVSFYKLVSERGVWDDDLVRDAEAAWLSDNQQEKEVAMLKWRIAAERGSEIAQNNLAYILDQGQNLMILSGSSLTRQSRQNFTSPHQVFTFPTIKRYRTSSSYTMDPCSSATQR
jgi:aryl-alcohol dehydrogenase-like predicted oxidoreductase